MYKIVIAGGGITGLASAYYLKKRSKERDIPLQITLLEASPRTGGKVISYQRGDFIMEGGPDSFLNDKPAGIELCKELGLSQALTPMQAEHQAFYLLHKSNLIRFPADIRLFVPQKISALWKTSLLDWPSKCRAALEPLIPPPKDTRDESIGHFVQRRVGKQAMENLAAPLMCGIYAGDPNTQSLLATFPRLAAMERQSGSLTKGFAKIPKHPTTKTPFTSLSRGMQQMTDALTQQLQNNIHLNTPVQHLAIAGPQMTLSSTSPNKNNNHWQADAIILTLPANRSADIVRRAYPYLADDLDTIPFASSASINLGYHKKDAYKIKQLTGSGFLRTLHEKSFLMGCTWASNKFPGRAHPDHFLLRGFIGGPKQQHLLQLDDDELISQTRKALRDILGIEGQPITQQVTRWNNANPQYEIGHLDRITKIENTVARIPGLHLAGCSYRGISLSDCIHDASNVADRILHSFA